MIGVTGYDLSTRSDEQNAWNGNLAISKTKTDLPVMKYSQGECKVENAPG